MKFSLKAAAVAAILALPAVGSAQSYKLYVGYADGLRGAVTFPDPWNGSSGVDFFSGFTGTNPDAGAIMFQNTGAINIFIESLIYSLTGPCAGFGHRFTCAGGVWEYDFSYALASPIMVTPGHFAIFTGTDNIGDFDTSDPGVGPCGSPNPNAPHLAVSVSGSSAGYDDTGRILDTGGVDQAVCPLAGRTNESFGWREIGTTGTNVGGNQVAPEPSTIVLTASGLVGLAGYVRRRRAQA